MYKVKIYNTSREKINKRLEKENEKIIERAKDLGLNCKVTRADNGRRQFIFCLGKEGPVFITEGTHKSLIFLNGVKMGEELEVSWYEEGGIR